MPLYLEITPRPLIKATRILPGGDTKGGRRIRIRHIFVVIETTAGVPARAPKVAPVLLVESDDRGLVVNAMRAGAKAIFLFNHAPFRLLCKCITSVSRGQIWINSQQTHYLLDALSEVPTLRVVNANGRLLLTPREELVVALAADGLSSREVAGELGLSEHTIKKYLLRIFDKLGISTRVELVLYAVSHGENRPAEWLPGNP
jgi:DNA-binding NarL/FixJ family response regulator